jgi:WD40 repeat protein
MIGVDGTVKTIKFSEDDRFLVAIGEGSRNGNDMAVWDMQNGSVVQYLKHPKPATCLCWGRTVVADASRRVKTPKYSIYTFHAQMVQAHFLEYDIRTMHFSLTTQKFRFPSTGLTRTYYDCCLGPTPGELLAGTSVGELVVFNAEHLLYRAALPIVTGGLLSLACAGSFVFVGAGDGKCKKLQGNDQYWSVVGETQVATPTVSSCSPTWTIADQPFPNSNSG